MSPERNPGPRPARLLVETLRLSDDWCEPGLDRLIESIAVIAHRLAAAPGLGKPDSVCICLTSDAEVGDLNRRFRHIDMPTNVLSFPAAPEPAQDLLTERPLGDVILARGTIVREARESGMPVEHHIAHLVAHGVLHLLGHDHHGEAEAEAMEALERQVLAEHGIADPTAALDPASAVGAANHMAIVTHG